MRRTAVKLKLLTHVAAAALLVSTAALAQTGGGSGGSGGAGGTGGAPSQGGPSIQKAPGGGGMQEPGAGGRQQLEKAPGGGAGGVPEPRAGQGTEKQPGATGSTKQKEQLQRSEKQPGTDTRAGERKERDGKGQARDATRGEGKKGAGGAGIRPDLSQEQRTTIRERLSGGPRAGNLNVNIAVGTRLPREVQVRPLPATVIEIVPQYRGYAYVLVGSQIVIVDPDTLEIVAVLAA